MRRTLSDANRHHYDAGSCRAPQGQGVHQGEFLVELAAHLVLPLRAQARGADDEVARIRCTMRRASNSLTIKAVSIVLPRPTSSASSIRGLTLSSTRAATKTWCGLGSIRALARPE
jgi:hypothetical protein